MEYEPKNNKYGLTSGTIGVSQRVSPGYETEQPGEVETSKLVFLARNPVRTCGHNQY